MKIAVVGHCGSGKSTIAQHLQGLGHDAYVVGQEHSGVSDLWSRRNPEALVYLEVSLDVVRERRGSHWPQWLFERQSERLQTAYAAADVRIDTGTRSVESTVQEILHALSCE